MLLLCNGYYFLGGGYITRDTFDTNWFIQFGILYQNNYDYFISHFNLHLEDHEVAPDEFAEVYFLDPPFWPLFAAFQLTDDFLCSDPCPFTDGVFALP